MIENLEDFNLPRPEDPPNNASQFAIKSWKKQLDLFWKQKSFYSDNKMKL
jgi:hypothetical protein